MKKISEDSVIKVYELNDTKEIENILKDKNWLQFKINGYDIIVEEIVEEERFQDVFLNKLGKPYKWNHTNGKIKTIGKVVKNRSTDQLYDDIEVRDETIKCLNKEIEEFQMKLGHTEKSFEILTESYKELQLFIDFKETEINKLKDEIKRLKYKFLMGW